MSATPETDAAQHEGLLRTNPIPLQVVTAEFARKLERERDEARAVAYDLAVIASHCLGSHGSALLTETSERIADTLKRWRELKQ
jgi:hypothetical protein